MANPSASGQGIVHNIGKYFMMLLVIAYIFTNSAIAYNDAHGNFKNIEWARIIYPNYVRNIVTDVSSSFSSDNGAVSTDTEPGDTASGNNPIIDSVIKNQNQDSTSTPKTEDKTNPTGNTNPTAPESSGEESSGWSAWKWILVVGIIVITFGTLTGVGLLYFGNRKIKLRKEPEGKELTYKDILDMKCVIANGKERTVREVIAFFYASLKDIPNKDLVVDKIEKMFDKLKDALNESDNKTFELTSSIVMTTSKLLHLFFDFITDLILLENLSISQSELIFNLVKEYEREISTKNNSKKTETDSADKSSSGDIHKKDNSDSENPSAAPDSSKVNIEDVNIISEENKKNYLALKKELIDEKYVYSQLFVKYANLLKEDDNTIKKYAIEVARDIISEFDSAAKGIGFETTLFKQIYETYDIKILESNLRNIFKMKKHTRDVLIAVLEKKREELLNSKMPSRVLVYGIIEELKNHGKEPDKSLEGKLKESISAASTLQKIAKSWIVLNNVILRKNIEADNEIRKCIEKIDRFVSEDNENADIILKNKAELEEMLRVISKLEKYFDNEADSFKNVNKMIESMKDDENEKKEGKIEAIYGFAVEMHTKYHAIEEDITRRESNELIIYVKVMGKIPEIKRYREEIENEIKGMETTKEVPVSNTSENYSSKPENSTAKIPIKYIGEKDGKEWFESNTQIEYFYMTRENGKWKLCINDLLLAKKPSQEYEFIYKKFFELVKAKNPMYYRIKEPAILNWDLTAGKGYLEQEGILEQVGDKEEIKNKDNEETIQVDYIFVHENGDLDKSNNKTGMYLSKMPNGNYELNQKEDIFGDGVHLKSTQFSYKIINAREANDLPLRILKKPIYKWNSSSETGTLLERGEAKYVSKPSEAGYKPETKEDSKESDSENSIETEIKKIKTDGKNKYYYELEDFKLILNNQIALYKSTGQLCALISVKIKKNISEILESITGKKDKITITENQALILITGGEQKLIEVHLNKLKGFGIHYLIIDDSIHYAEQFIEKVIKNGSKPSGAFPLETKNDNEQSSSMKSYNGDIAINRNNKQEMLEKLKDIIEITGSLVIETNVELPKLEKVGNDIWVKQNGRLEANTLEKIGNLQINKGGKVEAESLREVFDSIFIEGDLYAPMLETVGSFRVVGSLYAPKLAMVNGKSVTKEQLNNTHSEGNKLKNVISPPKTETPTKENIEPVKENKGLERIEYLRSIFDDIVQKKKNGDMFFFVEPVLGDSKKTYFENVDGGSEFIVYKFADKFYMYWNTGISNKEHVRFGKEELGFDEFIISYGGKIFGYDVTTKEMRINKSIGYDMGEVKHYLGNRWVYEKGNYEEMQEKGETVVTKENLKGITDDYKNLSRPEFQQKYADRLKYYYFDPKKGEFTPKK